MLIHIARAGKEIGQFTTEELQLRITERSVVPTDFAWMDGMEAWHPINEVFKIEWPRHHPSDPSAADQTARSAARPKFFFGAQTQK